MSKPGPGPNQAIILYPQVSASAFEAGLLTQNQKLIFTVLVPWSLFFIVNEGSKRSLQTPAVDKTM